ncbi:MAG: hypothetical protein ISS95_00365 [Candidatus Aenigmarchaeota archaeon]|nr:hypothetical protein [Candidatus Aenigmarchaeota archaeon]
MAKKKPAFIPKQGDILSINEKIYVVTAGDGKRTQISAAYMRKDGKPLITSLFPDEYRGCYWEGNVSYSIKGVKNPENILETGKKFAEGDIETQEKEEELSREEEEEYIERRASARTLWGTSGYY